MRAEDEIIFPCEDFTVSRGDESDGSVTHRAAACPPRDSQCRGFIAGSHSQEAHGDARLPWTAGREPRVAFSEQAHDCHGMTWKSGGNNNKQRIKH